MIYAQDECLIAISPPGHPPPSSASLFYVLPPPPPTPSSPISLYILQPSSGRLLMQPITACGIFHVNSRYSPCQYIPYIQCGMESYCKSMNSMSEIFVYIYTINTISGIDVDLTISNAIYNGHYPTVNDIPFCA